MRIIISPAKKMKTDVDSLPARRLPYFLEEAERLLEYLKGLTYEQTKGLWRCSDRLARPNYARLAEMDLRKNLTPALMSYDGIQYQYMAPAVFEDKALEYAEEHVRILSGLYGILQPFDGVAPYRLEMQAKVEDFGTRGLYSFWNHKLYDRLQEETNCIVHLASQEYGSCITDYLKPNITCISCVFAEPRNGKLIETGTRVKMARGAMVRFMAERQVVDPNELKEFKELDYEFSEQRSTESRYIFLKKVPIQ